MKWEKGDEDPFKLSVLCVCGGVYLAVWLSYLCNLLWAAGLAAPVSLYGPERRRQAILLCYPNAKRCSCQAAPSFQHVTQSCSLLPSSFLLNAVFSVSVSLRLFKATLISWLHVFTLFFPLDFIFYLPQIYLNHVLIFSLLCPCCNFVLHILPLVFN